MLTNIIASLLVTVVTNTYAPKQWLETSSIALMTYPARQIPPRWVDQKPWSWGVVEPESRDNPDVRIIEVRKVTTLSFDFDGRTYSAEVDNSIVSSNRQRRAVLTTERWDDWP